MTITAFPANSTDESASPCGCFACDKWADCAYCGNCTANDPRAAHDADEDTTS